MQSISIYLKNNFRLSQSEVAFLNIIIIQNDSIFFNICQTLPEQAPIINFFKVFIIRTTP